jgi:hypothetical protein
VGDHRKFALKDSSVRPVFQRTSALKDKGIHPPTLAYVRSRSPISQNALLADPSNPNDGDQGTTSKDLIQVPIGPITRARAKMFKDVLNGLIQELWAQINSLRPIEHDPQWQQRIVTLIQVLEG